jgi:hypothetical protein
MPYEAERELLKPYAVGFGLNLCCKNHSIGDSFGIDIDETATAAHIIADVRSFGVIGSD